MRLFSLLTIVTQQENESIDAPVVIDWAGGTGEILSVVFDECLFTVSV